MDDAAASAYISNFAARVFEGADAVDREGRATRSVVLCHRRLIPVTDLIGRV